MAVLENDGKKIKKPKAPKVEKLNIKLDEDSEVAKSLHKSDRKI